MANEINAKNKSRVDTLTNNQKDFLVKLRAKVREDENNSEQWKRKQIVSANQRLGIKRPTDFPYPGAPDIPLPETDKLIKKSIPAKVLSAVEPKKWVVAKLQDGFELTKEVQDKIYKAEKAVNAALRRPEVNWFKKLMLSADNSEQYGHCLARVLRDFKYRIDHKIIDLDYDFSKEDLAYFKKAKKAEKFAIVADRFGLDPEEDADKINDVVEQFNAGNRTIEFDIEVIDTFANINIELPTKVVVPDYTTDINEANRIFREEFWTRVKLQSMMDCGAFINKDLDNLKFDVKRSDDDLNEQVKANNEGVANNSGEADLYRLEIINTWFKAKDKAPYQRWIFVFLADVSDPQEALLQSLPFSFQFDGWDYEKYDVEIKDPRYYDSRGLPERTRACQEIMERSINNILIRDEINNTPMFEVLDTSEIMDSHVSFRPGSKLPVQQLGTEIAQVGAANNVDIQSERIISMLKAYVEEYVGSNDQLFRNQTNAGGAKTAAEIQAGIQSNAAPLQLTMISWHDFLSKVYQKFFEVYREMMVEPVIIDGELISPEDLDIPIRMVSNGSLELTEREFGVQKAMNRLLMVERFMQLGIATIEDYYAAANEWLERDGVREPNNFTTDPNEIMQSKAAQMQQALQQMAGQLQAGQQELDKLQKTIARNQTKMKKDLNSFDGKVMGKIENGPNNEIEFVTRRKVQSA